MKSGSMPLILLLSSASLFVIERFCKPVECICGRLWASAGVGLLSGLFTNTQCRHATYLFLIEGCLRVVLKNTQNKRPTPALPHDFLYSPGLYIWKATNINGRHAVLWPLLHTTLQRSKPCLAQPGLIKHFVWVRTHQDPSVSRQRVTNKQINTKCLCYLTLKEPGYFDPSHSRRGGGFRPP